MGSQEQMTSNRESFLALLRHCRAPKVGRLLVLILLGGDGGVSGRSLGAKVQAPGSRALSEPPLTAQVGRSEELQLAAMSVKTAESASARAMRGYKRL